MKTKTFTGRAIIRVHHGDCMDALRGAKENQWKLAICDPQYGISRAGQKESAPNKSNTRHGGHKFFEDKGWDNKIPDKKYFKGLMRAANNQIIWGGNYFAGFLPSSMGWIFWDKLQRGFNSDGELAFTSFDVALKVVEIQRGVLASEGTIHPTQKPIRLYKWLLQNYAKEGDTILDTHGGSMSIAIACWDMGFDLDIWELDEDYFKDGCDRIEQHTRQGQFDF